MLSVNYQKRKNIELFKEMEDPNTLFLSDIQNYIPIYNKFFNLNETNYNNINLNNKWYIDSILKPESRVEEVFSDSEEHTNNEGNSISEDLSEDL